MSELDMYDSLPKQEIILLAKELVAERDRLRDALEKTITHPWQRGMSGDIEHVRGRLLSINKIARTALQEAGDG